MRNIIKIILFLALFLFVFASGLASAEMSSLSDEDVPLLDETNYRDKINMARKCVVLYFRSNVDGTYNNDKLIEILMDRLPKDIKFFKVDLSDFSKMEAEYVAENDIGKKVVPSIVPYSNGFTLSGKVLGPAKKKWVEGVVSVYLEEFK
jgi:hypothetical protein